MDQTLPFDTDATRLLAAAARLIKLSQAVVVDSRLRMRRVAGLLAQGRSQLQTSRTQLAPR